MPDSYLRLRSSRRSGNFHALSSNQCEAIAGFLEELTLDPGAVDRAGLSMDGTRALLAFLRKEA